MDKTKYRLTDDTIEFGGNTLHRIEAVRDFGNVRAGARGGYVQTEDNLSHFGDCWIYDTSIACENAVVTDNASVLGHSIVRSNAMVCGSAMIRLETVVDGDARLSDRAGTWSSHILDRARVSGDAEIMGSQIKGHATVCDRARVSNAVLDRSARVCGDAVVVDTSVVGCVIVGGTTRVRAPTTVSPVVVTGFKYDAVITDDHVTIGCQCHPNDFWTKGMFIAMTKGYRLLVEHRVKPKDAKKMIRALRSIIAIHTSDVKKARGKEQ